MSNNKAPKKISRRSFTFFGGIALCLFSVILILNVGIPARVFALPFAYLFGLGSYAIYIFIYAYGLFIFFREKGFKIRPNNYLFGSLVMFISVLMISTLIVTNKETIGIKDTETTRAFFETYKNMVDSIEGGKGYWKSHFINLFQGNPFGGGLVGYAIVGSLNSFITVTGTWVVSVLVLLLGLFIFFYPVLKKMFFSNRKAKEKKQKEEKPAQPVYKPKRVENYDVIASASQVDAINEVPSQIINPNPINNRPNYIEKVEPVNPQQMINNSNAYGATSNFVPAKFTRLISKPLVMETAPASAPVVEEKPVVNEQMQLNFEQRMQTNEALVTAKPEFIEPVNVAPAPQVAPVVRSVEPEPQISQPVVRKPIKWVPPSSQLLETLEVSDALALNNQVAEERVAEINNFFGDFRIGATCESYIVGPSVTRYNISYGSNVSVRSVAAAVQDISIRLGGVTSRFEEVVIGQKYSGLEIPNAKITAVSFKEVYESLPDVKKHPLAVVFGKSIDGKCIWADFDEFPHVLVAGTTGSGKSIFTHSIVCTLIMRNSPEDLKLVLIDPKKVEMNKYRDLPHLLCPIINDANIAKLTMSKLCDEMNRRYEVLMNSGVSNIQQYNELLEDNPNMEKMPYIVVIVDEYADLVDTCKDIGQPVVSIAQKARAAGIHMLIATQRPSTNIITGVIKGNLPTRVALAVASYTDSMTILGLGGAEKLLGRGDMLVQSPLISRNGAVRLQGCYIQNKEINHIVGYLKEHYECIYDPNFCDLKDASAQAAGDIIGSPEFQSSQDGSEEAKYNSVKEWVMSNEYMSMSRIQRECGVGFNRAGRFFKRLQDEQIVATETEGNKGCPVLVHDKFYEGSSDTDIPVSDDQSEI